MGSKQHEAIAKVSIDLVTRCQAAVGSDEQVDWAMSGFEGPNPVARVLMLCSPAVALVFLPFAPIPLVVAVAVLLLVGVVTLGTRTWKSRLVALTPSGAIVMARSGRNEPGEVIGRTTSTKPTQVKDVWRGYEIDGAVTWVSKLSLEARDAAASAATTEPAASA